MVDSRVFSYWVNSEEYSMRDSHAVFLFIVIRLNQISFNIRDRYSGLVLWFTTIKQFCGQSTFPKFPQKNLREWQTRLYLATAESTRNILLTNYFRFPRSENRTGNSRIVSKRKQQLKLIVRQSLIFMINRGIKVYMDRRPDSNQSTIP